MRAKLFCKTGQLAGASFVIEREAAIGTTSGCTIQLYPKVISGRHARIYLENDSFFIEELGSRNGTRVDGIPLTDCIKLDDLNVITLADTFDFIFQVQHADSQPTAGADTIQVPELETATVPEIRAKSDVKTREIVHAGDKTVVKADFEPAPDFAASKVASKPMKYALKRADTGDIILLASGRNTVGRSGECAVTLHHHSVSRTHAQLIIENDRVLLSDLGSMNHTFVDKKRVDAELEIFPGCKIRFGDIEVDFTDV